MLSFTKIQEHIAAAHTEAEGMWASVEQRIKGILHAVEKKRANRAQERKLSDILQAAVVVSDPKPRLSQDQIQARMPTAAFRDLQKVPETFSQVGDQTMTAAYVGARRWGSRTVIST